MTRASSNPREPVVAAPTPPEPIEPLLTADDLAAIAGVTVRTIRRWNELGQIPPALRIGAVVRWRRSEVEAFLRDGAKPVRRGERK